MKKALIVTALAGFVRSFLMNDIKTLQQMDYEVTVVANKDHEGAENIEAYFDDNNVHFINVDFSSNKPFSFKTIKSYFAIKKIVKQEQYDLIHVHTPIVGIITRYAARKTRKKGTKVIYTTHGFYFHSKSSKKSWKLYYNAEKMASKWSDLIITINNEDYNNAKSFNTCNVEYIPGVGVNLNRFRNIDVDVNDYKNQLNISPHQKVILTIGELSHRKNHVAVLEALNLIDHHDIVYLICGIQMNSKGTEQLLKDKAKEYNIDMRLLGLRKDIPQICKCANLGIIPSLREGLGLAGIEMIAAGLPVIGSNVQGIRDYIIEGINGSLVDIDNFQSLASSIVDNLEHHRSSPESVSPFSLENSIEKQKEIYLKILERSNS